MTSLWDSTYEEMWRVSYGSAQFIPVCEYCGRLVKADEVIYTNDMTGISDKPNATCSKCGRTHMLFEGFM